MMRVLVCGDRNWTDRQTILKRLSDLPYDQGIIIIHGCNGYLPNGHTCKTDADLLSAIRGVDALAHQVTKELGMIPMPTWPDWSVGRSAGPQRNRVMLSYEPDLVIAFHDNIAESRGTANMIAQAKKAGIPVELIDRVMR